MNELPKEILKDLHIKFSKNLDLCLKDDNKDLSKIFSIVKGIAEVGQIIKNRDLQKHQIRCCNIFDEVFSDLSISIYLAANALDKPARIILRRALEIGVAAIYLWDMPHLLYSWDYLEKDLSFTEIISHLASDGFIIFVQKENDYAEKKGMVESKRLQTIYRDLSDIVHGKIKTFETELSEKFTYNENDWQELLNYSSEISGLLLKLYLVRFDLHNELIKSQPSIKKHLDEILNG